MASKLIEKLRYMPSWTNLSDIDLDVHHVERGLYSLDDGIYLLTVMHDQFFNDVDAPLIVSVMWASSEMAIRRCVLGELIVFSSNALPPSEISLDNIITYGDLTGSGISASEHASYTMEGNFLHKTVSYKGCSYYFLSRHNESEERPFAIRWNLKKSNNCPVKL